MNQKYLAAALLVLAILTVGSVAALYTGIGPLSGDGDDTATTSDFPTPTPSDETDPAGSDAASTSEPPFTFRTDEIEDCGQTCRDVTVTLSNNQNETATDVTVYTRIYAGQTTDDTDDIVWEHTQPVGTLGPGESYTTTERVELTMQEGYKIQQHDGWITILTTVESTETQVTFEESEQVA